MISTLQNSIVAYKALQLTYPLIVGIAAQVIFFFLPQHRACQTLTRETGCGHLHLLDHPKTTQTRHQDHVQRNRIQHHPTRWLGMIGI